MNIKMTRITVLLMLCCLLFVAGCGAAQPSLPSAKVAATATPMPADDSADATEDESTATPTPAERTGDMADEATATPTPLTMSERVADEATATPTPAVYADDVPSNSEQIVADIQERLYDVYDRVNPAVVNIQITRKEEVGSSNDFFFSDPEQLPEEYYSYGNGSGFIWDKEGHIVTNSHVVNGVDRVMVTFSDGTMVEAEVIGEDPDSDLAVVYVDVPANMLQPVEVADSAQVQVGQMAIAIGSPFGLENTMTVGFVSAIGRSIPVLAAELDAYYSIPDVIQSDNSINPGNSGGVLVDDLGRLIGVTSAIRSPVRASVGIGFSIPSAIVTQVVPVLIEQGYYEHPWLGVSGTDLTPDLAQEMGLDADQRGALVVEAIRGGPSDKAGVEGSTRQMTIEGRQIRVGGDVIVAMNGQPVQSFDDIPAYLARSNQVGDTITLTVMRDGKEKELEVTLDARPTSQTPSQATAREADGAWLGVEGRTLIPAIAAAMDLAPDQRGVLVEQVLQDSPADEAEIRGSYKNMVFNGETIRIGGDIIVAVDDEQIRTVEDLEHVLGNAQSDDEVTLALVRDGERMEVKVTLGSEPR